MRRIALAFALAVLASLGAAGQIAAGGGCHNVATAAEGTSPDVRIDKCQFQAAILRIPVGTTVTWTNADVVPHVVSGTGWGQTASMLMTGDSYTRRFGEAGVFPYSCPLHPGMNGVVLVGDAGAPASQPALVAAAHYSIPPAAPSNGQDNGWTVIALLAAMVTGAAGLAAGRASARH